MIQNGSVSDV